MALKHYKPITNGRRNMTSHWISLKSLKRLLKSHYYNRYRKERDVTTKVN